MNAIDPQPAPAPRWSMLGISAGTRAAFSGILLVTLWAAVFWAIRS